MLVCVSAGHSVAVIHVVYCPGRLAAWPGLVHDQIGVIRPFKAFIVIPGTIAPIHAFKPLAPPYSAVYGVSLWTLPPVVVVSLWCGVAPGRVAPGSRLPVWGSGALPTVGRGRWWVLPYYRGAPMVGCPLQWG